MSDVRISPSQALQIMAISVMLRDGELEIIGNDPEHVEKAVEALTDTGQEIALQIGNVT